MGDVLCSLLTLAFWLLFCKEALSAVGMMADQVREARVLRRRGRTSTATILSLGELDPEASTRAAVVRFEAESGREVEGAADLRLKGQPDLVIGAQLPIRYDPADPRVLASEAGRRQGRVEIREAVVFAAVLLVAVVPTSICLVYGGLHTLLS